MRPLPAALPPSARLALILAALVFALFAPMLWRGEALAGGDLINQYIPYKHFWAEELRAGRLPLWNPHSFGGRPHMADVQLGTFYPPNWLLLALPLAAGFTLLAALHLWWGGWGMALFLRRFGLGEGPALLGGALYALGGFQTSRLFPGIVLFHFAASWLPWALAALWAIEAGRAKRGAIGLAFVLTMQLFTGAPQVLYFTLLFVGLIFALRIAGELWAGRGEVYANDDAAIGAAAWLPASRRWGAALAGSAALFLIMGSPQWPATMEFSAHTVERAEGASYRYATDGSVAPRYLLLNIVPEIFGPLGDEEIYWGGREGFWEISCWMGVAPPLLAALALLLLGGHWMRAGRDSLDSYFWRIGQEGGGGRGADAAGGEPVNLVAAHRLFLAAIVVAWGAGWLLALGGNSPLYLAAYYVLPFLNKFRVPGRFLLFHFLAVSVLAPLALHLLLAHKDAAARRFERRLVLAALALCGAAYLALGLALTPLLDALGLSARIPLPDVITTLREAARLSWLRGIVLLTPAMIALILLLKISARVSDPRWRKSPDLRPWLFGIVAFVCVFDLLTYGWRAVQAKPPTAIAAVEHARSAAVEALAARRELGRFLCLDSVYDWQHDQNQMELFPNRPMMHGLDDARGYDPLYLAPWAHAVSVMAGLPVGGSKGAFLFAPAIARPPIAAALNIRTVLSYDPLGAPFVETQAFPFPDGTRLLLYDNPAAMGWAWLAGVESERPAGPALIVMASRPERLAQAAMLDADDWDWLKGETPTGDWAAMMADETAAERGAVTIAARQAGRYDIRAALHRPSLLVVSENFYPGWRAFVDGEEAALLRVNHALMGVALGVGEHEVVLQFANPRMLSSIIAALAAAVLALALLQSRYFESQEW